MEQLRLRLEHLRRVNLTLRQEIEVYEALYHNKEVSRDLSKVTEMSEENLLRQHLTEIRKLRQQLEKLDVARALGNEPIVCAVKNHKICLHFQRLGALVSTPSYLPTSAPFCPLAISPSHLLAYGNRLLQYFNLP